jgi:hypothetical protein
MVRERQKSAAGLTPKGRVGGVFLGSESSNPNFKQKQENTANKFQTARPGTSA